MVNGLKFNAVNGQSAKISVVNCQMPKKELVKILTCGRSCDCGSLLEWHPPCRYCI